LQTYYEILWGNYNIYQVLAGKLVLYFWSPLFVKNAL
jgi:hypothetical protein